MRPSRPSEIGRKKLDKATQNSIRHAQNRRRSSTFLRQSVCLASYHWPIRNASDPRQARPLWQSFCRFLLMLVKQVKLIWGGGLISLGGTEALGVPEQVSWDAPGGKTKRCTVGSMGWMDHGTNASGAALQCSRARMQGLHVWVDSESWWPLPFPSEGGLLEFLSAFANFSQHSQISSRLALSGLFERIVLKSHHQGQGSQGLNGRDGQRGARRFVVKYRVGRSGVDRCVRRVV